MGCQSTAVRSDRGLVCVLVDVPPQAMCEQGFGVMEEAHQRALAELQLQHQREQAQLQKDKEQLLAEETAATLAGDERACACCFQAHL